MAIRVVSNGNGETHVAASHFVIDPHGMLHIYTGELHTASYRDWSSVVQSQVPGTPPPEAVVAPTPQPPTPQADTNVTLPEGATLQVVKGDRPRRAHKTDVKVPRGGFGAAR